MYVYEGFQGPVRASELIANVAICDLRALPTYNLGPSVASCGLGTDSSRACRGSHLIGTDMATQRDNFTQGPLLEVEAQVIKSIIG